MAFDREQARNVLKGWVPGLWGGPAEEEALDRLAACVRPVADCEDAITEAYMRGVEVGRESAS